MLDGWRYIGSTFIPLKRNFPMFTTSFRKETFVPNVSLEVFNNGLDQIHEQNNKLSKGRGGASDLLNKVNDSALNRQENRSPEFVRIIVEFEDCLD